MRGAIDLGTTTIGKPEVQPLMIDLVQAKQIVNLMKIVAFTGLAISLCAQIPASANDAYQIKSLMSALSNKSKTPADVLNPNLAPSVRDKDLNRFSAPNYDLSIVPEAAPAITDHFAAVPVRVSFDDRNGNTLNASVTAHFIKVGNTWYFSDFDFMKWPVFLIAVLVAGILIGIAYAATILVLLRRLIRDRQLRVSAMMKMFFPIFWPSLFRATR